MDFLIKATQLILSLSILVILHEFGHYIAARAFKIRVEKFYLFFNPWFSLFKKKIGETEWGIGWLPLGGYVKISGMIDESMDKEQMKRPPQPWEFRSKPAWQRLIVMIGGVVVNLILGFFIYAMVVYAWGEEKIYTKDLKHGLAINPYLQKYQLHSGDNILKIDGEEVTHINDINAGILIRGKRKLTVKHQEGKTEIITLPEDVDYELFEKGAFPVVNLRHQSTTVELTTLVAPVPNLGLKAGDLILPESENVSDSITPRFIDLSILRGKDTILFSIPKEKIHLLKDAAPAWYAGLQKGDKIIAVNQREIVFFDEIVEELYNTRGKKAIIEVDRNGKPIQIEAKVSQQGKLGFAPKVVDPIDADAIQHVKYSFFESIPRGIEKGWTTLTDYIGQMKFLFTQKGASSIGGFGAIGNMFPSSWNWQVFWLNTAFISIVLAFMNILPIPALDGGHVVFLLYEMITGKEAPEKVLEYAQIAGFIILMTLLLYANGNDIYRWLFQ